MAEITLAFVHCIFKQNVYIYNIKFVSGLKQTNHHASESGYFYPTKMNKMKKKKKKKTSSQSIRIK